MKKTRRQDGSVKITPKLIISIVTAVMIMVFCELSIESLGPDWDYNYLRTLGYMFSGAVGLLVYTCQK